MRGRNVLQPMGWDAIGLPAENAAIERRVAPAEWDLRQHRAHARPARLGYDWGHALTTCWPEC
ncbi:MAG: hypothetical protein ACREXU_22100 [Gammaproteobacteria bacterium]